MRIVPFCFAVIFSFLAGCESAPPVSRSRVFHHGQADVFSAAQAVLRQMNFPQVSGDAAAGRITASTVVDTIAALSRWKSAEIEIHARESAQTEVTVTFREHFEEISSSGAPPKGGVPFSQNDGTYAAFFELVGTALGDAPVPAPVAK